MSGERAGAGRKRGNIHNRKSGDREGGGGAGMKIEKNKEIVVWAGAGVEMCIKDHTLCPCVNTF